MKKKTGHFLCYVPAYHKAAEGGWYSTDLNIFLWIIGHGFRGCTRIDSRKKVLNLRSLNSMYPMHLWLESILEGVKVIVFYVCAKNLNCVSVLCEAQLGLKLLLNTPKRLNGRCERAKITQRFRLK